MKNFLKHRLGWRRALPDSRDYPFRPASNRSLLPVPLQIRGIESPGPDRIDGSGFCSPIVDQEELGSCTGQAEVGFGERMQLKLFGRHIDLSALFSYYTGRYEMEGRFNTGDIGCTIKDVMKAAVKYGICPESDCPYDIKKFDEEPSQMAGLAAQGFKPKAFYRLDPPGTPKEKVLANALELLAKGYSFIAGFSVFSSIDEGPDIPYPDKNDSLWGGHAVQIVGYDKKRTIGDCQGAFQFPNTWGIGWGDNGYGWLPFDYLLRGELLCDLWTAELFDCEDLGVFG